jgi:hypothetical protein
MHRPQSRKGFADIQGSKKRGSGASREVNAMAAQTMTLEALKGQSLEELLQQVADQRVTVTVLLPDGTEVVIEPRPRLKPLPILEGHVPVGWKDAVYGRD